MGTLKTVTCDDFNTLVLAVQPFKDWILIGKAPSPNDPPPYRVSFRSPDNQDDLYLSDVAENPALLAAVREDKVEQPAEPDFAAEGAAIEEHPVPSAGIRRC